MDLFLNFDMNIFQENRKYWDQRVAVHVESEFYDVVSWKAGKSSLNPPELELLPANLKDVRILHLMCHFGQDSISLSRMGARVTGVDFSSKAIIQAKSFAEEFAQTTKFVQSNLYELEEHSLGEYDIVFMSYGTLLWLDDLPKWAQIVAKHLKPYGKLILVDFHPVCMSVGDDGSLFHYPYFNRQPIVETTTGSYADPAANVGGTNITFNYSFQDIFDSVLKAGLRLEKFKEWDYSPYPCFSWLEGENGIFRHRAKVDIPYVYGLIAEK